MQNHRIAIAIPIRGIGSPRFTVGARTNNHQAYAGPSLVAFEARIE